MVISDSYWSKRLIWILMLITHWNNSQPIEMLLHSRHILNLSLSTLTSCEEGVDGAKRRFWQYFSYIVPVSFIGGGNRNAWRKPQTCSKSLKTYHIMLYWVRLTWAYWVHLAWAGFELTMLMVIGTDCIGSCKSNYHMIAATMAPCEEERKRKS